MTIGTSGRADVMVPDSVIAHLAATHVIAHPWRLLHPDKLVAVIKSQ